MQNLKLIPDTLKQSVRTYFLQSFEMRSLQNEFNDISQSLKVSLYERLKFEMCEFKLCNSHSILYLRLYMIQQFQNLKKFLEENKPQSVQLKKMSPTDLGNQYKRFMFELINLLTMEQHNPGDKVLKQNDAVLSEDQEWKEDSKMYFIVTGNYKVESLMFDMQKKRKAMN